MADNIAVKGSAGTGAVPVKTVEISGVHYPVYFLSDADGTIAYVDEFSGAVGIIDQEHLKIHAGKLFTVAARFSLANGATKEFLGVVPASGTFPHFRKFVIAGGNTPFDVDFFEGTVTSDDGTTITGYNNNRNSTNTHGLSLYADPTVTTDGTNLEPITAFSTAKDSGGIGSETSNEWIMKLDTKYLFRITNNSGGTENFTANMFWYE